MAPSWWKVPANRLKPCSEFLTEACDTVPHDGCCSAAPCSLCLELETYADGISYGTATFNGTSWTGTVGGLAFVSYWERSSYGECEYVVTLDAEEVYRATCYEGASCRDPGGSVGVTIGYDEGTLTWAKHEPRPLALTTDPDTGCNDFFCGTCRCTCDCLCVTITEPDGTVMLGEICSTSYPCDAPIWEGSIGYYDLSIALGRDDYTGDCTISLTASGEDADPVFASGCGNMSASVTLYDGTIIRVACKVCECETNPPCEFCCTPINYAVSNPFGVIADIPFSLVGCKNYEGTFRVFPGDKPCQEEMIYDDINYFGAPFLQTDPITQYSETGSTCLTTPCSTPFFYKLECTARYSEPGHNNSCDRLWLWIGTNAVTQVGDTGETPGGHNYGPGTSWTRVRATSCVCGPTGVAASFDASWASSDCSGAVIGTIGPCAGNPLDCCPIGCSGTLSI